MTILVGYIPKPEGDAALRFALSIARDRGEDVLVMGAGQGRESALADGLTPAQQTALAEVLDAGGVEYTLQPMTGFTSPADQILEASRPGTDVTMVVLGIKGRSAAGKFLLGSNAQRVIQESNVPVVTVKAG